MEKTQGAKDAKEGGLCVALHVIEVSRITSQGALTLTIQPWEDVEPGEMVWQRGDMRLVGGTCARGELASHPLVLDESQGPIAVAPLQLREQTEYNVRIVWEGEGEPPSFQCFPELHFPVWRPEPGRRRRKRWSGRLNFRDYVGHARLEMADVSGVLLALEVEVRSRKLGYLDEYVALLDALAGHAAALVLRAESPVFASFLPDDAASFSSSGFERFLLLRHWLLSEEFVGAIEVIRASPCREVQPHRARVALERAVAVWPSELSAGLRQGGRLRRWDGDDRTRFLPQHVPRWERRWEVGGRENHFVTFLFSLLRSHLEGLVQQFQLVRCGGHVREVRRLLGFLDECRMRLPFVVETKDNDLASVVFPEWITRPGYRELFLLWKKMERALVLEWSELAEAVAGPLRDMAQLYEYWCFLELWEAVAQVAEPLSSDSILRTSRRGLFVELPRQEGLLFRYRELHITLTYQRRFGFGRSASHSYSVALTPDYTLELQVANEPSCFVCFDAKYRPDGALEKMHAYRDALRGAIGAYLLYPGEQTTPTLFALQPEQPFPGVGAFPLRPRSDDRLWLSSFLEFIFEQFLDENRSPFYFA